MGGDVSVDIGPGEVDLSALSDRRRFSVIPPWLMPGTLRRNRSRATLCSGNSTTRDISKCGLVNSAVLADWQ